MMVLYDDPWLQVVLPEVPATTGHVEVVSKHEAQLLSDLPDEQIEHLFFTASYVATAIFELLGVQGTNMLLTENQGPLTVHILARTHEDHIDLQWPAQQTSPDALKQVAKTIRDEIDILQWKKNQPQEQQVHQDEQPEKPIEKETPDKINYQIKHLRRTP